MPLKSPYLAILDVGHGNCAVLRTAGTVVVIDTGARAGLSEFLFQQGIREIDTVLISHADQDHIGALAQLIASGQVRIRRVHLNANSVQGSVAWDDLVYELARVARDDAIQLRSSLSAGREGVFQYGDARIEVLAPSQYLVLKGAGSKDRKKRSITTNSISAVFRICWKGSPVGLVCGDLDMVGLQNLAELRTRADAEVLLFPHHGGLPGPGGVSPHKFVRRLVNLAKPRLSVFSTGRGRYRNPNPAIVSALRRYAPRCRILCTQLSESCAAQLRKGHTRHLSDAFANGKQEGHCCAGTVVIGLSAPRRVVPRRKEHLAFIHAAADRSLCLAALS